MIISLAIAYAVVSCLFLLAGYATTARSRLHMPLAVVASALWPISLLVITGYICGERLGLFSGPAAFARDGQRATGPITARAADDVNRRIRQPVTSRAVGN